MKTQLLKTFASFCLLTSVFGILANAQIVYTDVNPDQTFGIKDTLRLDLNNDGINDFNIVQRNVMIHKCFGGGATSSAIITPAQNDEVAGHKNKPDALSINSLIDATSTWDSAASQILAKDTVTEFCDASEHCYCLFTGAIGNWNGVVDKYLGLRINSGGNEYYGWARLNVSTQVGTTQPSFTIKDYAYNNIPNQPILAGETNCGVLTVSIDYNGSLNFCTGDSVLLSANTTANIFQWQNNGIDISGASSSAYTATTSGNYDVKVSDSCSSFISEPVNVQVTTLDLSVAIYGDTLKATQIAAYQWIDCATILPIPGATNQSFIPPQSGSYSVQLMLNNCTGTSACYHVIVTGISDAENLNSVSLLPNPFSQSTTISFSISQAENISLKIYDVEGRLVKTLPETKMLSGKHQINWNATDENGNAVSTGIYFLKIQSSDFSQTEKLMVVK